MYAFKHQADIASPSASWMDAYLTNAADTKCTAVEFNLLLVNADMCDKRTVIAANDPPMGIRLSKKALRLENNVLRFSEAGCQQTTNLLIQGIIHNDVR